MTDFTTTKYISDAQMQKVPYLNEDATQIQWYKNIQELELLTGMDIKLTIKSSIEEMKAAYKQLTETLQKQLTDPIIPCSIRAWDFSLIQGDINEFCTGDQWVSNTHQVGIFIKEIQLDEYSEF
jgi:hypothetical protein